MAAAFGFPLQIKVTSRITALIVCAFLVLSGGSSAQNAPALDQQGTSSAGPVAASSPVTESSAQVAVPQLYSKPRVHVIRLNEAGTGPAPAPLAVAGAHATYFGGPVISSVHVVQVIYGSGSFVPNVVGTTTPTIAQYFTDIVSSGSLIDMLSEYNTVGVPASDGTAGTNQSIGHGTFDGVFTITPSTANNGTTITDSQIQTELLAQVAAGKLPAPVIDAQGNNNTLYMIYFPAGKTINDGTSNSCVRGGFCAYHNSTTGTFSSHRLFYGVFPDVQPPSLCSQGCGAGLPIDIMTNVASHELSEAISDADVGPATTFARPLAWVDPTNGEIGDICVGQEAAVTANGTTYTVQQEFSNVQNDCVAAPPVFQFTAGPTVTGGQLFDLDLRIEDSNGPPFSNLTGYLGTVHFTSTDPNAVLPADYTFTLADAGFHHFVAKLNTSGAQTITATDTKIPAFNGSASLQVTAANVSQFKLAAPMFATTGTSFTVIVQAVDATSTVQTNYTGTVHFSSTDAGASLPADTTLTNGVGTFTATYANAGIQTLTAADKGNASITGTAITTASAPSAIPTTTTITTADNPTTFGQGANYVITVTGNGVATASGTMTITVDGQFVESGGVLSNAFIQVPGGTHAVIANYQGDGIRGNSSSAPFIATVNPASVNFTVTSSASSVQSGSPVTFRVSPSASRGLFTFLDGTNPIAVIPASQAFQQGLTLTSLSVGNHLISVSFSGSPDFLPATSAAIPQQITPAPPLDYSISTFVPSATILAGQSATFQITTKSISGFTGNVTFSCGTLPALTTCDFTPPTAFVSPAAPTLLTTLLIKTTGPHAQLLAPAHEERRNARLWTLSPFALGIMLLAGASRRSRSRAIIGSLVGLIFIAAIVSCGGGSSTPPPPPPPPVTATPAGTSTIVVSGTGVATSGTSPANPKQQLNITLTVQP